VKQPEEDETMLVSIFNDVLGPVMRGNSSSHCAAALRIGRLCRDLMGGNVQDVLIEFDRGGSLPTTHDTQGSDMGLFGGLLGWEADDERLPDSMRYFVEAGNAVRIETIDVGDPHPNTYRLTLRNGDNCHTVRAISTGGGMIEVIDIDGAKVSIFGDYYETLLYICGGPGLENQSSALAERVVDRITTLEPNVMLSVHSCYLYDDQRSDRDDWVLVRVTTCEPLSIESVEALRAFQWVDHSRTLGPVLPVRSYPGMTVPFRSCRSMLDYDNGRGTPMWKLAIEYERSRGGLTESEVMAMAVDLVRILKRSIAQGIVGTEHQDRVLAAQAPAFAAKVRDSSLLDAGALNSIVLAVTALMDVKSSMGVIVAMPTAGACAALPGAVIAMAEAMGLDERAMAKALLASGVIGLFIATEFTFAAEVGGCQVEGGSAASMAAAALVTLADGTLEQSIAAASMALQSMIGLICDPVANRVESPCLGKNVMAAANAVCCANMALAGFDQVIPLDEVIETVKRVAGQMPRELRCTGLGGLSITPTSIAIQKRLEAAAEARKSGCGKTGCGCG
jgi:L-serine dehydratase